MNVDQIVRSFGLTHERESGATSLRRYEMTVRLDVELSVTSPESRNVLLAACLGVRLGLDRLRFDSSTAVVPPSDLIQRLVPRSVVALASKIAAVEPATRVWLPRVPFSLLFVHESGKEIVFASASDLGRGPEPRAIDDARRATFYRAYQLRPSASEAAGTGRVGVYRTTGGLASSVATLFPDFDLDASRERGVLGIPDYNTILVWRPSEGGRPGSALREIVRTELRDAPFPFSRRLYSLRPSGVVAGEVSGGVAEFDPADLAQKLISVM